MVFIIRNFWVSLYAPLFTLFRFIGHCFSRFLAKFTAHERNSNYELIRQRGDKQTQDNVIEQEEEEESESFLRFRFRTYEEFVRCNNAHFTSHSDYEYVHIEAKEDLEGAQFDSIGKSADKVSNVEKTVDHQISLENMSTERDSTENSSNNVNDDVGNATDDSHDMNSETENFQRDAPDDSSGDEKNSEGMEIWNEKGPISPLVIDSTNNTVNMKSSTHLFSDDESLVSDSDSDSMVSSSMSSLRSSLIDSLSDGFLSDIDFERAFEIDSSRELTWKEVKSGEGLLNEEDIELQNLSKGYETDDFEDEDEDILEELKYIESELKDDHSILDTKSSSGEQLSSDSEEQNLESSSVDVKGSLDAQSGKNMETETVSNQNAEKTSSGEQSSSDSDEQNRLESQWEHQDLVEQLKMEIKKVRAIGLPTILEESESPKIMDDLKPWKIEEKYQHEGTMDELHKFYKSYRERMRKLDILNYQKMYAIGFLRLKVPLQSFTKSKISTSALATIVSVDCWPCKPKSSSEIHQPVMKTFTRELESDLEKVYVGQMCLSWEFLCWEYGKALELWDSDPRGMRQYNEAADKFQTFQVLLTRFMEDEPFQGPRVQHYVKNRCIRRNLLQVPVIRDDNSKDRKKERETSSQDAITCLQLVEIIEESIRTFWQFIRSDKDASNAVLLTCRRSSNVELQNPADASLFADVRSMLQKKDKKLKELSRGENCLLRNVKKHHEDGSDNVLYFFSRVDLKLVSRVLNMPRITTEQIIWCRDKLSKINFVGKKLLVEPSVLLFPCS